MMYDLQLKKGGTLVFQEWDADISKFIDKEVNTEDVQFHFTSTICFATGITLKDIFLLISKNIEVFSIITACFFLEEIVTEALSETEEPIDKSIVALELKRIAVIHKSRLSFYFDFHGVGNKETHAIEFTPTNELASYPLILNEDISVENDETEEVYLKCKMPFSLLDVIFGIVEEISFMGPPDVRSMAFEEIKSRADDLKSGNIKDAKWEDLRKRMEEKVEKNKIPCKICGKDARTQCFDKPSDICVACFEHIKEN